MLPAEFDITGKVVLITGAGRGIGKGIAQVLHGVQINAISPGLFPDVVTAGEEGFRRSTQRAEQTVPLGRAGRLREVGFLALYLASAASDYMTGQTIPLDGGLSL